MKRTKKELYVGDLNKPIKLSSLKALAAALGGNPNPYSEQIIEEQSRKIDLLMQHYKIEITQENKWVSLALCLALDNVKGFKPIYPNDSKGLGRHTFWDKKKHSKLIADIGMYQPRSKSRRQGKLQITEACRHLLTQEPYKNYKVKGKPIIAATLARQYSLAVMQDKMRQGALSENPYVESSWGISPETYAAIMGGK